MTRYTSQLAVEKIGNRFDLVLVAARRAKELQLGARSTINEGDGAVVTALKEVEAGLYTKQDYLKYLLARKKNANHTA